VVEAYLSEVANFDQNQRQIRLNELDRVFTDKENELRHKHLGLKELADRLGSGDSQALSVKQQMLLQQVGDLRRQLAQVQSDLWRAQGEVKVQEAVLAATAADKELGLSQVEFTLAVASDPLLRQFLMELWILERDKAITESVAQGPLAAR